MKIDIVQQIQAITRSVVQREHEGRPARVVVATRTYDTTVEDLWDAITNAERIPRWFLPISGELRLGGRFQLEGNAGGEILRCEPPRHLAVTWQAAGMEVSWVDVHLHDDPNGARLELEHVAHIDDALWEQFGPGAVGIGWDLTFIGLAGHLESKATVDPQEAAAWTASDEGKQFMRDSSDAWGRASAAGGTPEQAAMAAAARTSAMYGAIDPPADSGGAEAVAGTDAETDG